MSRRASASLWRAFANLSTKPFQNSAELETWLKRKGLKEHHARQVASQLYDFGYTEPDLLLAARPGTLMQTGLSSLLIDLLAKTLQRPLAKYSLLGQQAHATQATTVGDLLDSLPGLNLAVLDSSSRQLMPRESPLESDATYAVVYEYTYPAEFKAQPEFKAPDHPIVAMEPIIEKAMTYVRENVDRFSDGDFRVPPIQIASLARSGKTLTLKQLFNAILTEGKNTPIFVTFNGQSGFKRNLKASDTEDFIRAVTTQLDPDAIPSGQEMHTYFSRQGLSAYLSRAGKSVVLLVDELNSLSRNPSSELSTLLREMFLDPAGRYLCFTSHRNIDLSEIRRDGELGGDTSSPRGRLPLMVAHTLDFTQLQSLFEKGKLNPYEVAFYCGLPGLIYAMKTEYNCRELLNASLKSDFLEQHLDAFLEQVRTGKDCCPPTFEEFTYRDKRNIFVWPLCYVEAYFARMAKPGSFLAGLGDDLAELISDTKDFAKTFSGEGESLVWEYTVRVGMGLAAFIAYRSPHIENPVMGKLPKRFQLRILYLPEEIQTLDGAKKWIDQQIGSSQSVVALAFPRFKNFPLFDGIIRCSSPGNNSFWRGVQMKPGNDYLTKDCPDDFPGILIRGDAGWSKRENWSCLTYSQLEAFLPYSMWPLIPHSWKPEDREG